MKKIKAIITLVVDKGVEVSPGSVCEVSDDEAKRLIALGFAKAISSQSNNRPNTNTQQPKNEANNNDESNQKSGGQPVLQAGTDGDLQK